jgi:hypothetical protein
MLYSKENVENIINGCLILAVGISLGLCEPPTIPFSAKAKDSSARSIFIYPPAAEEEPDVSIKASFGINQEVAPTNSPPPPGVDGNMMRNVMRGLSHAYIFSGTSAASATATSFSTQDGFTIGQLDYNRHLGKSDTQKLNPVYEQFPPDNRPS